MTTYTPFAPSQNNVFSFQPTLDGNQYLATIQWNLFGQRWYLNLTALDGTLVVLIALIESPPALPLASLSWANGTVTAVTQAPHGYRIGSTVSVAIEGCAPSGYNAGVNAGTENVPAYVLDGMTLTYPLIADPGPATMLGAVDWTVNIVAGYFETSSLVFRNSQFEVSP